MPVSAEDYLGAAPKADDFLGEEPAKPEGMLSFLARTGFSKIPTPGPAPAFEPPSIEDINAPGIREQTLGEKLRGSGLATALLGSQYPSQVPTARDVGAVPAVATALAPLAAPESVVGRALLAYFVGKFALDQPKIIPELQDAYRRKDWRTFRNLVGEEGFATALTALAAKGVGRARQAPGEPGSIDIDATVTSPPETRPALPPGPVQGPPAPGAVLRTPPGAPAPPLAELPPIERLDPIAAAVQAHNMQREGTAAYEPPRLLPPVVPGTPAQPRLSAVEEARQKGADTINKILDLFPSLEGSRVKAREIRDVAFPEKKGPNASPVRTDQSQLPQAGSTAAPGEINRGGDIQQAAPGQPDVPSAPARPEAPVQAKEPEQLKAEDFPPPAKKSSQFVRIQTKEGNIIPAYYEGAYMDLPDAPTHKQPWISYLSGAGGWSTGMLHPGDTILDPIESFEDWQKRTAEPPTPPPSPAPTASSQEVVPSSAPVAPVPFKYGAWTEEQWSHEALKKAPIGQRVQMAKFLGLRDAEGMLRNAPKDLAEAAKKRIEEIKANAAKPKEPAQILPQAGQSLIDVPVTAKPLEAQRTQIMRMLDNYEEEDQDGNVTLKPDLTEEQETRAKKLRVRLAEIEKAMRGEPPPEAPPAVPVPAPKPPVPAAPAAAAPIPSVPTTKPPKFGTKAPLPTTKPVASATVLPDTPEVAALRKELAEAEAVRDSRSSQLETLIKKGAAPDEYQDLKRETWEAAEKATKLKTKLVDTRIENEFAPFRGQPEPQPSPPQITNKVLKAQKENLLDQVAQAIKDAPESGTGKITISVPGDGDFTLDNTKESLTKFRDGAAKAFPGSIGGPSTPGLPSGKGKAIPKVAEPKDSDLGKIAGVAVSDDPARFSITVSYSDGTQIVATNGRQLLRIITDRAPGTPAEPVRLTDTGTIDKENTSDFPNYTQVLPTDPTLAIGGLATEELWHLARQAQVFGKNYEKVEFPAVNLFLNPDRSIGGRMEYQGESFEHNIQPNAISLGAYNSDYLFDAADVARRLGNEKVDMYVDSDTGPAEFIGKNSQHVIMPIRIKESAAIRDNPSKITSAMAGPKQHVRPGPGLPPLRNPEGFNSRTVEPGTGQKWRVSYDGGQFQIERFVAKTGTYGSDRWDTVANFDREELARHKDTGRRDVLAKEIKGEEGAPVSGKDLRAIDEAMRALNMDRQKAIESLAERAKMPKTRSEIKSKVLTRAEATAGEPERPTPTQQLEGTGIKTEAPGAQSAGNQVDMTTGKPVTGEAKPGHLISETDPGSKAPPTLRYSGVPLPVTVEQLREIAGGVEVMGGAIRRAWRSFAMKQAPRITDANPGAGEAGVHYAVAPMVAREKGLIFAGKTMAGVTDKDFDVNLGQGISEDNLRHLKQRNLDLADDAENREEYIEIAKDEISMMKEAADDGDPEAKKQVAVLRKYITRLQGYTDADAKIFRERADGTFTFIGAKGSQFPTEAAYRSFMESPDTKAAIKRHKTMWAEQKEPLYRMAADVDPEVELETRGLDYGARINLKAIFDPAEVSKTTVGNSPRSVHIRQTATMKRKDPFAFRAEGQGEAYEGSYTELMAHGFGREYPVAMQHEFIRKLIDSGNAAVSVRESPPGFEINGEKTVGRLLQLRPWYKKWLQVPVSLAPEYDAITGLTPASRIRIYTDVGEFLTKLSITGLAEGTTHVANLLSESFTGLGPTANPLLNALLKVMGRSDLVYRLPRVLIRGFSANREQILELAEIGAAKNPYRGTMGWLLNKIDIGSRLVSKDIYQGMARAGWVPDSETGLREFINQLGNYTKKLQPGIIRWLRDTHVQPFATAMQTFNTQGLRRMVMAPGAQGTSWRAAAALRADIAAGWMGFVVVVAALNYLLSGKAEGEKGTKLGAVGWKGEDGKLHQIDLGMLTGFTRGPRILGIQAAVEARRQGLSPNTAQGAALRSIGNTILSEVTGPLNRFGAIAVTGARPGVPMVQEAKVAPPRDDYQPLRSQLAENIGTALRQSSPLVDAVAGVVEGKSIGDIAQRQASRFTPRTGLSTQTIENLPRIVKASEVNAYADALGKEARKQPIRTRWKFVSDKMAADQLTPEIRNAAVVEMRKKGTFRYP